MRAAAFHFIHTRPSIFDYVAKRNLSVDPIPLSTVNSDPKLRHYLKPSMRNVVGPLIDPVISSLVDWSRQL